MKDAKLVVIASHNFERRGESEAQQLLQILH